MAAKMEVQTAELQATVFDDSSLYLVSTRLKNILGPENPDEITMPREDTRVLYELLKQHFEGVENGSKMDN